MVQDLFKTVMPASLSFISYLFKNQYIKKTSNYEINHLVLGLKCMTSLSSVSSHNSQTKASVGRLFTLFFSFQYIELLLSRTSGFGEYQKYVIPKLRPIYDRIGFETRDSDSFMDISLRELIVTYVCDLDYEPCVKKSVQLFKTWMESAGLFPRLGFVLVFTLGQLLTRNLAILVITRSVFGHRQKELRPHGVAHNILTQKTF